MNSGPLGDQKAALSRLFSGTRVKRVVEAQANRAKAPRSICERFRRSACKAVLGNLV
jgi:hypothetical protein